VSAPGRWLLALGLVVLATLSGCGGAMGGGSAKAGAASEQLGAPAPDFSLAPIDGGTPIGPKSFAGKVLIVDFWATWCTPCRQSFPVYQKLLEKFPGQLALVGVSVDESQDGIAKFKSETGVRFPVVWDQGQSVAGVYKPGTMPTSFVIDRAGIVKAIHEGFRQGDDKALEQEIRSLL
jgi:cytochrome c biogenesis protein CcmG/thiol:disulfide interchange protein DsbE